MRAVAAFIVSYAGIRLKVRVLPHAHDVYKECTGTKQYRMRAELPVGFFAPEKSKFTGTIVIAGNCDLLEIVPHEVFHAVMHKKQTVHAHDDEPAAYAIGVLTSRIIRKIQRRVE